MKILYFDYAWISIFYAIYVQFKNQKIDLVSL